MTDGHILDASREMVALYTMLARLIVKVDLLDLGQLVRAMSGSVISMYVFFSRENEKSLPQKRANRLDGKSESGSRRASKNGTRVRLNMERKRV